MNYSFEGEYAEKYGLEEAVLINYFIFWIRTNMANETNYHDGRTWTYNSVSAFEKLFPFWSKYQIERILKSLIKQEVLITGNYNSTPYDRTLWYAFLDEKSFKELQIPISVNAKMENAKQQNGKCQKAEPIPVNIPVINPVINTSIPKIGDEGNSGKPIPEPFVEAKKTGSGKLNRYNVDSSWVIEIYRAYPRSMKPQEAKKAIAKALNSGVDPVFLRDRTIQYANSGYVASKDIQYISYPASWYNARSWEEIDDNPHAWDAPKEKNPYETDRHRFFATVEAQKGEL